jgi:uncharacterized protein
VIGIKRIISYLYLFFGLIFMGLGMVGIILPLVPTTPFLLLASYCFVRGSEKFDVWFKGTNFYKKYLENFINRREMTFRQKMMINILADAMIAIPFIVTDQLIIRIVLLLIVGYKYYYFIFKIKTVKERGGQGN